MVIGKYCVERCLYMCCLLGCHLRGVICRPISLYIFYAYRGGGDVIIVFELEKQLGLLRSTLMWMTWGLQYGSVRVNGRNRLTLSIIS